HVIGAEPMPGRRRHEGEPDPRPRVEVHEEGSAEREKQRPQKETSADEKPGRSKKTAKELHFEASAISAARMRGSRNPIKTSTEKFATSTVVVTRSVQPVMSG